MLAFAAISSAQAASFDFVPLLFVAYVIYAIISGLVKASKQAQKVMAQAMPSAQAVGAGQAVTPDQIRATLALRRAAAARVQQQAAPPAPPASPVVVRLSSQPSALAFPAGAATNAQMDALAPMSYSNSFGIISGSMDIAALLASLPPAAQAIVASAVIGPCAAHRGGGHNPEDW